MYSNIKVFGNGDFNYIWSREQKSITEDELNELAIAGINKPVWNSATVSLSTFTEDIDASDIEQDSAISRYVVKRYDIKRNKIYTVASVDSENTSISDYNVSSEGRYQYTVIPIFKDADGIETYGSPIETDPLDVEWDYWTIVSLTPTENRSEYIVDTDNIWRFQLDVKAEDFKPNQTKNFLSGYGKFPKAYTGISNYLTGSVSCYIGNVECGSVEYTGDNIVKIESWVEFCNNGKLKLLKDRKGHVIFCEISDTSYNVDEEFLEMPTTISFNFTQLIDEKKTASYGLE